MTKEAGRHVENLGIEEERFRVLVSEIDNIPAMRTLNMILQRLGSGKAVFHMSVGREFSNYQGNTFGGLVSALMDTAMGVAALTIGANVVTLEMNLNYFANISLGETVVADGWVAHGGNKTIVTEGEIRNRQGKLVAKGRGTFYRLG